MDNEITIYLFQRNDFLYIFTNDSLMVMAIIGYFVYAPSNGGRKKKHDLPLFLLANRE